MTIGEELKRNFSKKINRNGEIFKAMVANDQHTGAMESILLDVEKFTKEYYGTPDIYQQTGDLLNKTISFYTYLERIVDETEEAIKRRIAAIFYRKGDVVWGTPFDVLNVFRQYFPSAQIYLIENTNSNKQNDNENLIMNGEFQEGTTNWTLSDDSIRVTEARFSKSFGIKLSDNDYAKQTINIPNKDISYSVVNGDTYSSIAKNQYGNDQLADYIKNYADNPEELTPGETITIPSQNVFFLHFFLKGNCKVKIENNLNQFWNPETESWDSEELYTEFHSKEWIDKSIFFICKNNIDKVTVTFAGSETTEEFDYGYVDYIRLFQKFKHPSFTIIAQFEGNSDDDALALAEGHGDQDSEHHTDGNKEIIDGPEKYDLYGYYDNAFLTGVASGYAQDLYEDLIEYVKSQGIKAYIEIVNRDYIEEI